MDIVGRARKLERKIARSVDAAVVEFVGREAHQPIEVLHAVLRHTERQVQDVGRGRRAFPFNRIVVHVLVAPRDRHARARFAAVFDGPPPVAERVHERLAAAGCTAAAHPLVDVVYASKRGAHWIDPEFHVEFERETPAARAETATIAVPRLKLTVLSGKAAQRVYVFTGSRVDIGRRADVLDTKQRLVRTNHVAFTEDGPDANRTVSRKHAHIVYVDGAYRLCDDRSTYGSNILRAGRTIPVPAGPRGARLQAGDEILLGRARLRVGLE